MKIFLKKAFELLDECYAVLIDDVHLAYPTLDKIRNDPENEFLYLEWSDENWDFNAKFGEGNNQLVEIWENGIYLYDSDDEKTKLTLLQPVPLMENLRKES